MSYFKSFPQIYYQFPDDVIRQYTDISIRPAVVDEMLSTAGALEKYQVRDGETPETIAFDLYGNVDMHWVIMLANNIMNVYTDWPRREEVLRQIVRDKYRVQQDSDGYSHTLDDIAVEEFIEFVGLPETGYTSEIYTTDSDNAPKVTMHPHHFEDADGNYYAWGSHTTTIDAFGRPIVMPELYPVSHWEYEVELNEKNRFIYVPTTITANKMQKELRGLVNG